MTFSHLARYERQGSGEYYRALHELQRLQAARAGQLIAPPAALDIDIYHTVAEQIDAAKAEGLARLEKEKLQREREARAKEEHDSRMRTQREQRKQEKGKQ